MNSVIHKHDDICENRFCLLAKNRFFSDIHGNVRGTLQISFIFGIVQYFLPKSSEINPNTICPYCCKFYHLIFRSHKGMNKFVRMNLLVNEQRATQHWQQLQLTFPAGRRRDTRVGQRHPAGHAGAAANVAHS